MVLVVVMSFRYRVEGIGDAAGDVEDAAIVVDVAVSSFSATTTTCCT